MVPLSASGAGFGTEPCALGNLETTVADLADTTLTQERAEDAQTIFAVKVVVLQNLTDLFHHMRTREFLVTFDERGVSRCSFEKVGQAVRTHFLDIVGKALCIAGINR